MAKFEKATIGTGIRFETDGDDMVIRVPIGKPIKSSTGVMLIAGGTGGAWTPTGYQVDGENVRCQVQIGWDSPEADGIREKRRADRAAAKAEANAIAPADLGDLIRKGQV